MQLPTQVSESVRRRNPDLFGLAGLPPAERQQNAVGRPAPADAPEKAGPCRLVICIVQFRKRTLDTDNLAFAVKALRDAIAASLGVDDGDPRLRWEYGQVETRGRCGVLVTFSA